MLIIGFAAFFWVTPKEGASANEIAAANVARMEANVAGTSSASATTKQDEPKFLEKFKQTRENQLKYLMIIMMVLGVAFLLYSFLKKEKDPQQLS